MNRLRRSLFLVVTSLLLAPQVVRAHPHPPEGTDLPKIVTAFPNGTGRIEICTKVFETPSGFTAPVNGVPTSFCHMWVVCVQILEMPMPLPAETIGSIAFDSCGNPFLALGVTQCQDGNPANDSALNDWVIPEWEPGVGQIKFSIPRPLGRGLFDNNILSLVFFTNAEPAPGNITLTGVQCNGTCHAVSVTVPGLVPCGPTCGAPGTPPPGTKPPGTTPPGAGAPCPHAFALPQVYPATPSVLPGFVAGKSATVPGVLCLATSNDHLLNVNAFLDPACCASPVVQAVRLTKVEAAARKCPSTFPGYTVTQVGRERIRTWWPLNYTPPGTIFTLEVIGVCGGPATTATAASSSFPSRRGSPTGSPAQQLPGASAMNQTYVWSVVADPMTFRLLIDLEHTQAIGMSEIPCIADERIYRALVECADRIRDALAALATSRNSRTIAAAQESIFGCEAVLFSAGMLFDHFPAFEQPPGNFLPAGMGVIDTIENPCLCKLIADVDAIFVRAGLDGGV